MQISTAGEQFAFASPHQALTNPSTEPVNSPDQVQDSENFDLFGKDGFTFWDFLDIINPLQHIPVVSTIYRSITGDEIDHGAKIAGGALFGGPLGAASSVVDVMVTHNTGKDLGEHAMAILQNENQAPNPENVPQTEEVAVLQNFAAPTSAPYGQALGLAATVDSHPLALLAQENAQQSPSAGMTAIPVAKETFIERAAAFAPKKLTPRTAPDLGLLSDLKSAASAKSAHKTSQPLQLTPKYSTSDQAIETKKRVNHSKAANIQAMQAYEKVQEMSNGWVHQAMLAAMDKYDSSPGGEHIEDAKLPMIH